MLNKFILILMLLAGTLFAQSTLYHHPWYQQQPFGYYRGYPQPYRGYNYGLSQYHYRLMPGTSALVYEYYIRSQIERERIKNMHPIYFPDYAIVVKKRGGGERIIKAGKWYIDPNTPPGDDALYFELKPFGGRKEFYPSDIIRKEDN